MQCFGVGIVLSFLLALAESVPSCVQCDSSQDDICATSPDQFLTKSCSKSDSQCYVRIVDGKTVRGCTSDLDQNTINNCNNDCLICGHSESCNSQIYPQYRLKCIQCKGELNSTCATETYSSPSICPLYKFGDVCIVRKSVNKNEFIRGCLSSYDNDKCKDQKQCYVCNGNGCNYLKSDDPLIPLAKDSASWIIGNSILILLMSVLSVQ